MKERKKRVSPLIVVLLTLVLSGRGSSLSVLRLLRRGAMRRGAKESRLRWLWPIGRRCREAWNASNTAIASPGHFPTMRIPTKIDPNVGPEVTLPELVAQLAAVSVRYPPLLPRDWVLACGNSSRDVDFDFELHNIDLPFGDKPTIPGVYVLRFMQFNMLAEGLSAPPADVRKPPFSPPRASSAASSSSWPSAALSAQGEVKAEPLAYGGFDAVMAREGQSAAALANFSGVRRWRLLEEILRTNPDVLAVQEIDHFHDFFAPALAKAGYEGVFAPKQRSKSWLLGYYSDGIALFWKKDLLQPVATLPTLGGSPIVLRQQPAPHAVVALEMVGSKRPTHRFVVAATHLKSKDGEVEDARRQMQIQAVLDSMEDVMQRLGTRAAVLMGDLNTAATKRIVPGRIEEEKDGNDDDDDDGTRSHSVTPVIGRVLSWRGPRSCQDEECLDGYTQATSVTAGVEIPENARTGGGVERGNDDVDGLFVSAYPLLSVPGNIGGAIENDQECGESNGMGVHDIAMECAGAYTTWKKRGKNEKRRAIDYIFVSRQHFSPVRLVAPPRLADVPEERLPCASYPSDHISIAADCALLFPN